MKNKFLLGLFLSCLALSLACRNGATKQTEKTTLAPTVENVEALEQANSELEQTTKEIEDKEAALEAALKDLD